VWIVFSILASAGWWLIAGLLGTISCSIIIAAEYRRRAVKIMDCTSLAYFATVVIMELSGGTHFIRDYHVVLVWTLFAAVAWIGELRGDPFTAQYARETAPPAVWNDPIFIKLNHRLTQVWAIIFTGCALLGAVSIFAGHLLMLGVILPLAAMLFGFEFSKRYPRRFSNQRDASPLSEPVSSRATL
jgi:hypothetical protein